MLRHGIPTKSSAPLRYCGAEVQRHLVSEALVESFWDSSTRVPILHGAMSVVSGGQAGFLQPTPSFGGYCARVPCLLSVELLPGELSEGSGLGSLLHLRRPALGCHPAVSDADAEFGSESRSLLAGQSLTAATSSGLRVHDPWFRMGSCISRYVPEAASPDYSGFPRSLVRSAGRVMRADSHAESTAEVNM